MKWLFILFICLLSINSLYAQPTTGQVSPNTWDASKYAGADICAKITNAAIAAKALSPNGATIDTRNIVSGGTCASPLYTGWPYPFPATVIIGNIIPSSIGVPPSNVNLVYATPGTGTSSPVTNFNPGMSMVLSGDVLDFSGPFCTPSAGNYSVAYRNSTAANCVTRNSDVFANLLFLGGSPATWTIPQSSVTTFTGSITGNTLTTPSNAVSLNSVITGAGVLDNTYVVSGGPTSWTINYTYTQPIGSETLTQSVYPPATGTCFKHVGTSGLLTIAAGGSSTIVGTGGVVTIVPPSTPGGPVTLYPGGQACLRANLSGNYVLSDFIPGTWYQEAGFSSQVSSFIWTGLSGYPRLHLSCGGMAGSILSTHLELQFAYGGAFQVTGYNWQAQYNFPGGPASFYSGSNDTNILLGDLPTSANDALSTEVNLVFNYGTGMGYSNDATITTRTNTTAELLIQASGKGPLTTSQPVTGIQLIPASGTESGYCWLSPRI